MPSRKNMVAERLGQMKAPRTLSKKEEQLPKIKNIVKLVISHPPYSGRFQKRNEREVFLWS
jgi:hypothetical protein